MFWQNSSSVLRVQAERGGSMPGIPSGGKCESHPTPRKFQRSRRYPSNYLSDRALMELFILCASMLGKYTFVFFIYIVIYQLNALKTHFADIFVQMRQVIT